MRDKHYHQARTSKSNPTAPVKDTKKQHTPFSALRLYFSLTEGQIIAQQAVQHPLNLSERNTSWAERPNELLQPFNHCSFCQNCKDNCQLTECGGNFQK